MGKTMRLTSTANPRIKQVLKLRTQRQRQDSGLFIAEGARELTRAVAARLVCLELYVCPELAGGEKTIDVGAGAQRFEVSAAVFRKMAYLREPQGMLAIFEQPRFDFAALPTVTAKTLYLVAVGLEKPGNLGAMVRTAEAAGCEAVLVADGVVDAFNPNALRASTGAVFSLATVGGTRQQVVEYLKEHRVRMAAAVVDAAAVDGKAMVDAAAVYTQADLTGALAIVIGPEDTGLDTAWRQAAADSGGSSVRIPMRGRLVDSLNASNAAAILLFEALRQRSGGT